MPDLHTAAERLRQVTPKLSQAMALKMAERLTKPQTGESGYIWRWDIHLDEHDELLFHGLEQEEYLKMLAKLDTIQTPTTIIYGAESGWITRQEKALIQAATPNTQPIFLSGGHNLHLDAPVELAKVIQQI